MEQAQHRRSMDRVMGFSSHMELTDGRMSERSAHGLITAAKSWGVRAGICPKLLLILQMVSS